MKKLDVCIIIKDNRFLEKHVKITQNQWRARLIPEGRLGKEDRGECFAPYISLMYIIIVSSVIIKLNRKAPARLASERKNYIENTFINLPLTFSKRVSDLIGSQWSFFFILKCFKKLDTCLNMNHYRFWDQHMKIT